MADRKLVFHLFLIISLVSYTMASRESDYQQQQAVEFAMQILNQMSNCIGGVHFISLIDAAKLQIVEGSKSELLHKLLLDTKSCDRTETYYIEVSETKHGFTFNGNVDLVKSPEQRVEMAQKIKEQQSSSKSDNTQQSDATSQESTNRAFSTVVLSLLGVGVFLIAVIIVVRRFKRNRTRDQEYMFIDEQELESIYDDAEAGAPEEGRVSIMDDNLRQAPEQPPIGTVNTRQQARYFEDFLSEV